MTFKRYILTGTPGSGKTSVILRLKEMNYRIICEAANSVIVKNQNLGNQTPWMNRVFIDQIISLQKYRQVAANRSSSHGNVQFYDRSPFCTYALAQYLGYTTSSVLKKEIDRCLKHEIYDNKVFFFNNLGFIENTNIRKISFEESLKFEKIHFEIYKKFGFEIIFIPKKNIKERSNLILNSIF